MAWKPTKQIPTVFGNKKVAIGTYVNDGGSTGGAIITGLMKIDYWNADSATGTPSVVGTVSGGTLTLTTTANQTGTWMAVGL
jgi:hypothetical protein